MLADAALRQPSADTANATATRIIAHNQSKGQQQVTINARPTASGTTTVRTDHVDRDNAVVMPL